MPMWAGVPCSARPFCFRYCPNASITRSDVGLLRFFSFPVLRHEPFGGPCGRRRRPTSLRARPLPHHHNPGMGETSCRSTIERERPGPPAEETRPFATRACSLCLHAAFARIQLTDCPPQDRAAPCKSRTFRSAKAKHPCNLSITWPPKHCG
jgi:hypothetical protein